MMAKRRGSYDQRNEYSDRYRDSVSGDESRGGVCVFYEAGAGGSGAAGARRLRGGGDGGGVHLESADSGDRADGGLGEAVLRAGLRRLLDRRAVSADARPPDSASARRQQRGGGAENAAQPDDDDGAGGDAPQYPGGHGGRGDVRGLPVGEHADHGGQCAGALARNRDSELPRGRHHLDAAPRGGGE